MPWRNGARAVVLIVLLAALTPGLGIGAAGASKQRTYFTNDCAKSRYRPHHLIATCGDASIRVVRIQWTHYGRRRADGHGLAITNTCIPNCAAGHFSHDAATVHLGRPRLTGLLGAERHSSGDHKS